MNNGNKSIERYAHEVRATTQEYARDLLGEYEKLLSISLSLKGEKTRLEAQIKELQAELERRGAAYSELLDQIIATEATERAFGARYVEVEQMSSNLANLYVASYRLHASLERDQVVSAIGDVLVNLLGSESFAIFEREREGAPLTLIATHGVDRMRALRDAWRLESLASGGVYVRPDVSDDLQRGPAVCIPLQVDGRVIGAIAIYSLLGHKDRLDELDHELCNLLATHAASALYSSRLYAQVKQREPLQ